MSKYFRTLNRLQKNLARESQQLLEPRAPRQEKAAEPATEEAKSQSPTKPAPPAQVTVRPAARRRRPRPKTAAPPASPAARNAYARLVDGLRALEHAGPVPTVVVTGVSRQAAASEVVAGIEVEARRKGLRVLAGSLAIADGARFLRTSRTPISEPLPGDGGSHSFRVEESLSLDLGRGSEPDSLRTAIERAAIGHDLMILEAPPLQSAIDAALLARGTAGLLLVAEPLITTRADLQAAFERAKSAGCNVLGVVLLGSRQWLPDWARRILDGTR